MKKLLLILLSLPMIGFGQVYKEKVNDSITIVKGYGPKLISNEIIDGEMYEKYDLKDSVLEYEHIYLNNKLDSITSFYGTGELWFQSQYVNGKRNGNHICYYKDGTIKYKQIYLNGILVSTIRYKK